MKYRVTRRSDGFWVGDVEAATWPLARDRALRLYGRISEDLTVEAVGSTGGNPRVDRVMFLREPGVFSVRLLDGTSQSVSPDRLLALVGKDHYAEVGRAASSGPAGTWAKVTREPVE
jgi:hypothetical protein